MKIQVRRGVFETNSSSSHSLVICSKDEADEIFMGKRLIKFDTFWDSEWKTIPADSIDPSAVFTDSTPYNNRRNYKYGTYDAIVEYYYAEVLTKDCGNGNLAISIHSDS